MKRFLSGGFNKGGQGKDPERTVDGAEGRDGGFPTLDSCLMIFGGLAAYDSKCYQKLARRKVYMNEPAAPTFHRWSESAVTFDQTDHPESVPQPKRYSLMVDLIIGMKRLTKVLMDGGSGLNIMYVEMLNAMCIVRSCILPTGAPFHGIMPRKQAMPLG